MNPSETAPRTSSPVPAKTDPALLAPSPYPSFVERALFEGGLFWGRCAEGEYLLRKD